MDLELIPKSNVDLEHKCEVCVQAKQTGNSFKPVERNTQILELIHSDVCDSNRSLTRGGNKITLKDNEKTPYELWKGRSPNLRILKVWGCLAKVLILDPKIKKIGPKTIDAVFLGYAKNSSANRFLVINSEVKEVANNTVMEARDATFFEDIFPY
ncbi:unnamed protein product [Prunus armeniaca]